MERIVVVVDTDEAAGQLAGRARTVKNPFSGPTTEDIAAGRFGPRQRQNLWRMAQIGHAACGGMPVEQIMTIYGSKGSNGVEVVVQESFFDLLE